MTTEANLKAAARAFAHTQWPISGAAIRPLFIIDAVEYHAHWSARVIEQVPRFAVEQASTAIGTLRVTVDEALMVGGAGAARRVQNADVAHTWATEVIEHMLAAPGAQPLIEWVSAQTFGPGIWADTVVEAVALSASELGLDRLGQDLRQDVLAEVGLMTLAQITALNRAENERRLRALLGE